MQQATVMQNKNDLLKALTMQQKYLQDMQGQDAITMAEGGMPMDRFEQRQEQSTVGSYVPPPIQSFQEGGTVSPLPSPETDPLIPAEPPKPTIGDVSAKMITTPELPTGTTLQPVGINPLVSQDLHAQAGQVIGQVALPSAQAGTATTVPQQEITPTSLQAQQASTAINTALEKTQAAQGELDPRTQVTAQQQTASSISQLQAAQGVANQMTNPVQRKIQEGEIITPTANAQTASTFTEQVQAATATPSAKATVAGLLGHL